MTDRPFTGWCPKCGPVVAASVARDSDGRCPVCGTRCTGPGADAALARLAEPTAREALEAAERDPATVGPDTYRGFVAAHAARWLQGWLARRGETAAPPTCGTCGHWRPDDTGRGTCTEDGSERAGHSYPAQIEGCGRWARRAGA